ncbi:MAG TPA: hypothetical protein PK971_12310, partial [Saprospiraceae bacterium]|nr:hypothetical protein [Saprospiraceae bacterium]HNG89368.1 hypothetical protein [Saprospiraceae bacterium]
PKIHYPKFNELLVQNTKHLPDRERRRGKPGKFADGLLAAQCPASAARPHHSEPYNRQCP